MSHRRAPMRLMLLSPTGSGKTLAFAIPLLNSLDPQKQGVKAIVLTPTRELTLQVFEVIRTLAHPEFKTAALYGGHNMLAEINSIKGEPDIIVATPGRLLDHIQRGTIDIRSASALVFDEYDKSLELGFLRDMGAIVRHIRKISLLILTSATKLEAIPEFLGKEAVEVVDYRQADNTPQIDFRRVDSPAADKLDTLEALLRDLSGGRTVVFLNHRDAAERVFNALQDKGFTVGLYHGGLEQDMRERALVLFANGSTPVLVATDLASRGLDIDGIEAVVHYHLPVSEQALTHRNGRTGRMDATGRAFMIMSDKDKIPDFIPALDSYWPEGTAPIEPSAWATLYFNAGKKEKISRGDIAGFLMQKGGLAKDEVGKIDVKDHCAYVAVPAAKARETAKALAPHKIKNTRVRVTQLK